MSKVIKFLRLELLAAKPDLRIKNIALLMVFTIFGYIVIGVPGITMGLIPFISSLSTYTFSAGNGGLDQLYASLSIKRQQVVFGRYLFIVVVNTMAVVAFLFIGVLASSILGDELNFTGLAIIATGLFVLCTISDFVSTPILFKLGFKKARMLASTLPVILLLGLLLISHLLSGDTTMDQETLTELLNDLGHDLFGERVLIDNIRYVLLISLGWLAMLCISLVASIQFYNKRNF